MTTKSRIVMSLAGLLTGAVLSLALFGQVSAVACSSPVVATDPPACQAKKGVNQSGGGDQAKNCVDADGTPVVCGLEDFIKNIINILLFLIGAIAVIMIIIGGIRYVVSNGDSSQTTAAKNTILYAVVGLVIAMMAYAIVNWVIGSI